MTDVPAFTGKVLVTGATGTIGWHLTRRLAGHCDVRVLVRDACRAARDLPEGIEITTGDLTDDRSLALALDGVETVFHAAGMPEQWVRDPGSFERVNAQGTRSLSQAALAAGVRSFVYTSTIDVFRTFPGVPFDESVLETEPLATPYERSKQDADRAVVEALAGGLPARFLHPSAVFGPSPSATPGTNDLLTGIAGNTVPLLPPGGMPVVFAPDVALGHLLAAAAPVGSRFILSDRYVELTELAEIVRELAPAARRPRVMPQPVARAVSALTEGIARLIRRPPLLPAGQLHFLTSHAVPDSSHARMDLGWSPTPLRDAIAATLANRSATP